jgi:hypothetical protein
MAGRVFIGWRNAGITGAVSGIYTILNSIFQTHK